MTKIFLNLATVLFNHAVNHYPMGGSLTLKACATGIFISFLVSFIFYFYFGRFIKEKIWPLINLILCIIAGASVAFYLIFSAGITDASPLGAYALTVCVGFLSNWRAASMCRNSEPEQWAYHTKEE